MHHTEGQYGNGVGDVTEIWKTHWEVEIRKREAYIPARPTQLIKLTVLATSTGDASTSEILST